MNLLQETLDFLLVYKKQEGDVKWVGTETHRFTWDVFKELADTNYDNGFGAQEVASDLMIVGDGWWMTRDEYDGSESWEFHEQPGKPLNLIVPVALTVYQSPYDRSCGWETLLEINSE